MGGASSLLVKEEAAFVPKGVLTFLPRLELDVHWTSLPLALSPCREAVDGAPCMLLDLRVHVHRLPWPYDIIRQECGMSGRENGWKGRERQGERERAREQARAEGGMTLERAQLSARAS